MSRATIDTEEYLKRIGYKGPVETTYSTLAALQLAHLRTVPFENLDIHLRKPIVLDMSLLYDKIVRRRRGGFCYECNGLFAELLSAAGFKVTMLSAGVAEQNGFGPNFDHMTLRVDLAEPWLVDVGFGDSFQQPLRLVESIEQFDSRKYYRFLRNNETWVLYEREENADWKPQFEFTLEPRRLPDYDEMCRFHQTSPESSFTRKRICSLATPNGRISLSENKLITTAGNVREERELSRPEYDRVLRENFGIELSGESV